ncbi:hypothetical protein QBC35DRAFT_481386 [Podospora australis]|uniref:Uncharacterized protein n=1 Tax=Podospora australis TaxID=1536484 RepID=A0AAN6X3K1_9PEZI|nr:hypothetical protein QBC35DRAFT_481386 [Podospora australis]
MSFPPPDRRVISGHTLGYAAPPRITRSEDRETASTSATSEEFDDNDFFDWDRYHADNGQETDVTTHSDVSAEGKHPAASPPGLFPVSMGTTPSDSDGDITMMDAGMSPHPLVWPEVDAAQPPREGSLLIESQGGPSRPSPPPHTDFPAGRQISNMPQPPKRSRVLECPEQTNQVRDAGACYHCRMNKSKCSPSVCDWCKKQPFPEKACVRRSMPILLGFYSSRWIFTETLRRDNLDESRKETLFISFTGKADSPCLPLTVAPFNGDQGIVRFGISSSAIPAEPQLLDWATRQMVWESKHRHDFESRLDSFHLEYVRGREPEPSMSPRLLKMKQMWKIWCSKDFFVHRRPGWPGQRQLGPNYSSIQDRLRHIAGKTISELERYIVKDVDDYLKKEKPSSSRTALDISKWLSLWQLVSIYRHSLRYMSQQEPTDAAPFVMGVTQEYTDRRRNFRTTTEELLRGLVVIYYDLFHKRTTIQAIHNPGPDVFASPNKARMHDTFKQALSANREFCKQVSNQNITDDQFFIEYLIKREMKVLTPSTKRR